MIFLYFIAVLVFIFYLKEHQKWKNGPPGPLPLPIVGNLIQLSLASSNPVLAIAKFSEKYGNIFKLKMGFKDIVFLSSVDAISEILTKDEALGRDVPDSVYDRQNGYKSGLALSEGKVWEETRKWTVRTLRNFGLGKQSDMQKGIKESVNKFIDTVEKSLDSGSTILDVSTAFAIPVTELIWKMLVGHFNKHDEVLMARLVHESEEMIKSGVLGAGLINAFPFLRFIFPKWTSYDIQMNFYKLCREVSMELFQEEKTKNGSNKKPTNLTEAYAKKLLTEGPSEAFSDYHYQTLFMDIFQAGSDTSSSYLESLLLFMVLYPDVQEKIYAEIQDRIPSGMECQFEDKESMEYTQAAMLEVHRHSRILQHLVPRKATESFTYKGIFIPKDTCLMADLYSAYMDPKLFVDPFTFNPDRFIDKHGKLTNQQNIISFSVGKRNCIGQPLAEVTAFLFFIRILQRYRLSVIPGEKAPRADMSVSFTSRPYPFKVHVERRSIE